MRSENYSILNENLKEARAGGFFNDEVGLVMMGRISHAFEEGLITETELRELQSAVFPHNYEKYRRVITIGNTGIPDEALEHTP